MDHISCGPFVPPWGEEEKNPEIRRASINLQIQGLSANGNWCKVFHIIRCGSNDVVSGTVGSNLIMYWCSFAVFTIHSSKGGRPVLYSWVFGLLLQGETP